MSLPAPAQNSASASPFSEKVGVNLSVHMHSTIPTGMVFAILLESLNRSHICGLLEKLIHTVEKPIEKPPSTQSAGESGGEPQSEILSLLALLRQAFAQHEQEVAAIRTQLEQLNQCAALVNTAAQIPLFAQLIDARIEERVAVLMARKRRKLRAWVYPPWLTIVLALLLGMLVACIVGWFIFWTNR